MGSRREHRFDPRNRAIGQVSKLFALLAVLVLTAAGCGEATGPEFLRLERIAGQGQERGITLEQLAAG